MPDSFYRSGQRQLRSVTEGRVESRKVLFCRPEPFPFRLNRNWALAFCLVAFSRREPVSTSLEDALDEVEIRQCGFPLPLNNPFGKGRQNAALRRYDLRLQALVASNQPIGFFAHIIQ